MIVDYSVENLEFLVGGINLASHLVSFSLSQGISDFTEPLIWRGSFEIARIYGSPHSESFFSELESPTRWRRGMTPVVLKIEGQTILNLRIDRYRYFQGVGRGELTQILGLIDFSRPSEEVQSVRVGAKSTIAQVVRSLMQKAIAGIGSLELSTAITDIVDVDYVTEDPLNDAQKLLGLYWQWLYVNQNGVVSSTTRPYSYYPLFVRSFAEVEMEPYDGNIDFGADKVIVSGACQVSVPYKEEDDDCDNEELDYPSVEEVKLAKALEEALEKEALLEQQLELEQERVRPKEFPPSPPQQSDLDDRGRPRKTVVETLAPALEVFPGKSTSIAPTLAEQKEIYNIYGDAQDIPITNVPAIVISEVRSRRKILGFDSDLICSCVVYRRPAGNIFPRLGTNTSMRIAEVEIEGQDQKTVLQPSGVINPRLGTNFNLAIKSKETVESGLSQTGKYRFFVDPKESDAIAEELEKRKEERLQRKAERDRPREEARLQRAERRKQPDPRTGRLTRFECPREREEPQITPLFKLETKVFKGVANLKPSGWNRFLDQIYKVDVGSLYSQGSADSLAARIAQREIGRRDGFVVTMPVPKEWLTAGAPPFAIAHIGTHALLIDSPVLTLDEDGSLKFGFIGERLGRIPEVLPPPPQQPWLHPEGLAIAPPIIANWYVGIPIQPVQLLGVSGIPPYDFSGTLPNGLTVSSTGEISGMPDAEAVGTFVVVVTDSASNTYSLTLNFSVEPQPVAIAPTQLEQEVELSFALVVDFQLIQSTILEFVFALRTESFRDSSEIVLALEVGADVRSLNVPPAEVASVGLGLVIEQKPFGILGFTLGVDFSIAPLEQFPVVAEWLFGGNYTDSVGTYDLTEFGDPSSFVSGEFGGSAVAVSATGTLTSSDPIFGIDPSKNFSLELVVKAEDFYTMIASSPNQWELYCLAESIKLQLYTSTLTSALFLESAIINTANWHEVSFVIDFSTMEASLTIDGVTVTGSLAPETYGSYTNFQIGDGSGSLPIIDNMKYRRQT